MQITVTVSEEIVRAAQDRNMAVIDFVEILIDKGLDVVLQHPALNSAIDRIRALRSSASALKP